MGVIKNIEYYNKVVTRFSMKSGILKADEIDLINEAYNNNSREIIYEFASKNKVLPFVAKLFTDLNLDKIFWSDIYSSFKNRNSKILEVLIAIFNIFETKGLKKVFLYENFAALLISETSIGCFASGDVDLFAHSSLKSDISKVLISQGFLQKTTNLSTNTVKTEYFNKNLIEKGLGINVMWKPLSRLKLPFQIDINNSIKWDHLITYNKTNIQIPNKESLMYLCLLHTSVHSYHRAPDIRLYTDTDRVALLKLNWELILNYARFDKTEVRILTSAILSNKLIGTSILNKHKIERYKKKYKNIGLLVGLVFDLKTNYLKNKPKGISVLLIEILSSDYNWIKSTFNILFPSKLWINEYYLQNKGKLLKGYMLHLKNLFS